MESLKFDSRTIISATNNFSDDRKLGEGGFGEVYRVMIDIHVHRTIICLLLLYFGTCVKEFSIFIFI